MLARAGAGHQLAQQPAALGLRSRSGAGADPLEGGVDLGDGQARRAVAGGGSVAQRRPAHADLALAQLAGQERHAGGDLVRAQAVQRSGQARDLLAPRGGRRDGL
jgi:hypothetical protein